MDWAPTELKAILAEPMAKAVVYLESTDASLLRRAEQAFLQACVAKGEADDPLRLDGPVPDFGRLIEATGAISLFGGVRLVVLRELTPSALSDKDAKELAALYPDLENAVLLVTALHKDKRGATSQKAKLLRSAAAGAGIAMELSPPGRSQSLSHLRSTAEALGASFARGAAEALLERAGDDWTLLESETQKLAAIAGYGEITLPMVERYGAHNVETDVFVLVRCITGGRRGEAFRQLHTLFALKHEPIAIAGALAGTFVDMLRVRTGAEARHGVGEVFRDMGYTGSDYRLKKAKENAARYSTPALEQAVLRLAELDRSLKSSALPDKAVLLEATVSELFRLREGV